jgi:hypothetical protein
VRPFTDDPNQKWVFASQGGRRPDEGHRDHAKHTKIILLSASTGEQRYLILEYKVRIFEGVVHQDDEFTHDGGEGDFGGFTPGA